jgi:antitoxin component of MazEF toxin-antitoxin module
MRRRIADSRRLSKQGNSITVTLPKRELQTYGVLDNDELRVEEASPYLDIERGVIGIEVSIPE